MGTTGCYGDFIIVIYKLADLLEKPKTLKTFVADRKGHDMRYAMDHSKITNELGWKPSVSFEEGIEKTITWYVTNKLWWQENHF